MSEPRHEIEIETVAEVTAVERQAISILYHDDEKLVQLLSQSRWGDLQSITWPVGKTGEIMAALEHIVRAETGDFVSYQSLSGEEKLVRIATDKA